MWEPKRRTRQCCRSAQKRIFSKCCNWKACTTAEQLGSGEAPGRDHSLISSQQERTMLTEQRVLQIQAILSTTAFSANREKCCKAKQGVFSPTACFFPNPFFWQVFSSSILTIQLFKERGWTGSSLKPHTLEPNCGGLLCFYNCCMFWWFPKCPNPMLPG